MIVQATQVPDFSDLLQTLKSRFPDYSVYAFDSKPQESIIVRKSGLVGAQISLHKDEIIVDACCPNIFVSALIGFISAILPPYHRFEIKITDFLKRKYIQEVY